MVDPPGSRNRTLSSIAQHRPLFAKYKWRQLSLVWNWNLEIRNLCASLFLDENGRRLR